MNTYECKEIPDTAPDFSPQPKLGVLLKYGIRYIRIYPGLAVTVIILTMCGSCLAIISPLIMARIISGINAGGSTQWHSGLVAQYLFWLSCTVGGISLSFYLQYVQNVFNLRMSNVIRLDLFDRIIHQSPQFFHECDSAQLTLLVNQMSIEAQTAFIEALLTPLFQTFSFLAGLAGLIYSFAQLSQGVSPALMGTVLSLVLMISLAAPLSAKFLGTRLQVATERVLNLNLEIATLVNSAFKAPEEVKVFNAENYFSAKFADRLETMRRAEIQQDLSLNTVNALNDMPSSLAQMLFLGAAIASIVFYSGSGIQAGYLVSILMLVPQIMEPVQGFASYMIMLRSSWPSVAAVLEHLDNPFPVLEKSRDDDRIEGLGLEVRNVVFRYRKELPPIFDGLSFKVTPGQITGLVGRIGQGKTTFFKLALGFYPLDCGEIVLGGVPVQSISSRVLRNSVVMMSQFPAFFHDTLRDNLRMAKPDATDSELEAVCRQTGIWDVLARKAFAEEGDGATPNPLDRQLAGGEVLSGGQKKLLAMSRCLLRSPNFLFLDEPTTGMDNLEKISVMDKLRQSCAGRTVMVVDHDIRWLARFCDSLVVIEGGRVVQQGEAAELLRMEGLFRDLHEKISAE